MKIHLLSCILLFLAAASAAADGFAPVRKKLVGHGWDLLAATPEEVLAHADAFDRTGLDGVTLMVSGTVDGRRISHSTVMNDPPWPRERLKDKVAVFREIVKHPSLKESFISSWWAPRRRLAWNDDAAWGNFASNMATVAWMAKSGGLRGVLVDAEDYPRSAQYFLATNDAPYDVTARLARRRGAQVFGEIFREFPDVVFLSFWMLSLHPEYFSAANPMDAARAKGDLWPWFVNGMLDVMPPTARFVDGNEHAYRYEAEKGQFYRSACQQRTAALGLVAPENRQKYLAQLRAGFGLYLDSYVNPTNSPWYFGPVDGSRLAHFARNLAQAVDAADEYVWVYGEKKAWVPWKGTKSGRFDGRETWDGALPGFDDEMCGVKAPLELLRRRLAELGDGRAAANLAARATRPWPVWQDERKPRGRSGAEGAAVFLAGVANGCHLVHVRGVRPGERHGVRLRMKGAGGSAVVYWQKDGRWQWQLPGVPVGFGPAGADGWRTGEAVMRVPEGADALVLQLAAHQRPEDKVSFDSVEIIRLSKTEK